MQPISCEKLAEKRCLPCEGGVPAWTLEQAQAQLQLMPGWSLTGDGKRIQKSWKSKNFVAAIEFFQKVAEVSEAENHHPDLHLESYRKVRVEIWTHAINGLSENDFVLAAKIDPLASECGLKNDLPPPQASV